MTAGLTITRMPTTAESVPFGTSWLAGDAIGFDSAAHGYIEEEFLVAGTATVWAYDEALRPVPRQADQVFATRILVRRPADPHRASGVVQVEALHPDLDSGFIWGAIHPWLVRSGHTWVGVTAFSSSAGLLHEISPERYGSITIPNEGLQYDIVGAVADSIARGELDGVTARRILLAGWSATGSFTRVFVQDGFHDRWRRGDGAPVFDGYVICISSGGTGLAGYPPLSPDCTPIPLDDPRRTILPHDVPVFELLSEMESETNALSLREDSDDSGDRYRLYQLAGTAHIEKGREALTNRTQFEANGGRHFRLSVEEERTDGRLDLMAPACFEALLAWIDEHVQPPRGGRFRFTADAIAFPPGRFEREGLPRIQGRQLVRDTDGNVVGGVRTPWIAVPTGRYSPHSTPTPDADKPPEWMPFSQPEMIALLMGSRIPFAAIEVTGRYGSFEHYRELFEAATNELVAARLLLAPEAAELVNGARARWDDSQSR